ncbi:hypothetical protein ACA910_018945 [Epithemia clementina (nom. ined.)]
MQDKDEILNTIAAMCQQEAKGYKTCDFLYQQQQQQQDECATTTASGPLNTMMVEDDNNNNSEVACDPIDVDCRTKMAAWCYQVVDFCKFHRETVAIAMNLLDRFVACSQSADAKAARSDRKVYQLAAMTALYTAVKIHEPEAMDPKLVSTLSRGTYTPAQVEAMERQLLTALTWRVNPPTAMAFVRQYMQLLAPILPRDEFVQTTIYDLTKFQTELAVSEYDFLEVHPSVVAFCSLLNSLESVGVIDATSLEAMAHVLSQAIGLQGDVSEIQMWLYQAVVQEPTAQTMFATAAASAASPVQTTSQLEKMARQQSSEFSPRSIAA